MTKTPRQIIADQTILQTAASVALARKYDKTWSTDDVLAVDADLRIAFDMSTGVGRRMIASILDVLTGLSEVYSHDELCEMARGFHEDSKLTH